MSVRATARSRIKATCTPPIVKVGCVVARNDRAWQCAYAQPSCAPGRRYQALTLSFRIDPRAPGSPGIALQQVPQRGVARAVANALGRSW